MSLSLYPSRLDCIWQIEALNAALNAAGVRSCVEEASDTGRLITFPNSWSTASLEDGLKAAGFTPTKLEQSGWQCEGTWSNEFAAVTIDDHGIFIAPKSEVHHETAMAALMSWCSADISWEVCLYDTATNWWPVHDFGYRILDGVRSKETEFRVSHDGKSYIVQVEPTLRGCLVKFLSAEEMCHYRPAVTIGDPQWMHDVVAIHPLLQQAATQGKSISEVDADTVIKDLEKSNRLVVKDGRDYVIPASLQQNQVLRLCNDANAYHFSF